MASKSVVSRLVLYGVVYFALTTLVANWIFQQQQAGAGVSKGGSKAVAALKEMGVIVHLKRDGSAKFVDLFSFKDIAKAIPHLAELPELEKLALSGTKVTDEQMQVVSKLKQLRELALNGTEIGDEGLKAIAGLSKLEVVNLDDCPKFTDAGLANLATHTSIERLHMNHTNVTNAGVKHLLGLTKLKHLLAFDTKIDQAGVDELKKSVPGVTVIISEPQTGE